MKCLFHFHPFHPLIWNMKITNKYSSSCAVFPASPRGVYFTYMKLKISSHTNGYNNSIALQFFNICFNTQHIICILLGAFFFISFVIFLFGESSFWKFLFKLASIITEWAWEWRRYKKFLTNKNQPTNLIGSNHEKCLYSPKSIKIKKKHARQQTIMACDNCIMMCLIFQLMKTSMTIE